MEKLADTAREDIFIFVDNDIESSFIEFLSRIPATSMINELSRLVFR